MKTFIVAEAGANHNQNYQQALALVDVAVSAKADAVKFQTYSSDTLYSKNTPDFAGYKNIPKLIKDIELPRGWHRDLKLYCDDNGIEFMSTPFDERAVEELYEIGVKRLKIAGFESTDPRFVRCVASTKLPLIITAGIGSDLDSIRDIIEWVKIENTTPDITILHGNNAYPTPFTDINLNQISNIKNSISNIKVGLSDHTPGILIPPLAVAKGASVIEKHFTLSRNLVGPDHSFAIEPSELKQMVQNIRTAEDVCKSKSGKFTASEYNFKKAMRSVVSLCVIKKGECFTEKNITTKRPTLENSIEAFRYYEMIGKKAKKDIDEDEVLTEVMI
jgi:sialic acid synthase SpsE